MIRFHVLTRGSAMKEKREDLPDKIPGRLPTKSGVIDNTGAMAKARKLKKIFDKSKRSDEEGSPSRDQ